MAQASIVRPSVNSGFSETLHESRPKFVESYISTISPFFFFFQNFLIFKCLRFFFFSFSLTWEPKFQNATSPTVSIRFQPNFMTNMIIMGEYRLLLSFFGDLPKVEKFMALKFLLTQDHMGLGISKRNCSYSFHPMSGKLLRGHWLP